MKINSIQFLRAIAVLLVVHVHAIDTQEAFSVSHQQKFFFLENFGAIGVDLFFGISGFIISYVAGNYFGAYDGVDFLKKRFLRINPIYYVASLIYMVLFCFFDKFYPIEAVLYGLKNTVLMLPVLNSQKALFPILVVGWSLSFEWWFYVLFFLLILARTKYKTFLLLLVIPALVIIGKVLQVHDPRLIFYTNPIMLEFLFGVIIYWLYRNVTLPAGVAAFLLLLGLGGYAYNIFHGFGDISELGSVTTGTGSLKRVLLWGLPSAFILAGCIFLEKKGVLARIWNNRFFLLLGDASYSIYLTHFTFFYLLTNIYIYTGFFLNADLSIFVHMALGVAVGILFYKKVERPLIKLLHPKPPMRPTVHAAMP
ncbi:peptidoglycan/LPS O-acetylase OafA/YrhL [Chitinophaga polysaccharea]|uniref:Peptidoglycan/LPS O-acetylase OafA/YrhL n=1 Tax=Chitinophaga polysaccharea TaxID=1293035 RepID=A0A561Q4L5_9BACT|nr:acyltransferase [Chitinophaga polysaccharea]TWF45305.1 peptidoglycan/LPS O-acetylase OafA/YrhL [Chitinophaga polysaccharea]